MAKNSSEVVKHISIIIVVVWLINLVAGLQFTPDTRGTFGDMFGGLTALFSGFAFVGVIYAILLQRQELEETRKELLGQKKELAASNKLREHQNFENTFFQMLRAFNNIVQDMDIRSYNTPGTITNSGRDCFRFFVENHNNLVRRHQHNAKEEVSPLDSYFETYNKFRLDLGHYYRTLYNLIKFVHLSKTDNKKFYMNIVRASLSDHEIAMLFLNCLSDFGKEKFKPLVEEYQLLKMFDANLIPNCENIKDLYADTAFKKI